MGKFIGYVRDGILVTALFVVFAVMSFTAMTSSRSTTSSSQGLCLQSTEASMENFKLK